MTSLHAIKDFDFIDYNSGKHYTFKKGTCLVIDRVKKWGSEYYYGYGIIKVLEASGIVYKYGYVELNEDCFEIEE